MKALTLVVLALVLHEGSCCNKKNPKVTGNVWQRLVGKDVQAGQFGGSGDNPVDTCDKLNCNFDNSGSCCWNNAQPPADQLEWVTLTGPTEPKKLQSTFGTQTAPTGTALGAGSETKSADGKPQQAQLYSCPVICTQGQIAVTMQHWKSKDVIIKVCQETDPAGPLSNCQQLPVGSGNTDTVNIPGGQNVRVVIVAEGFTEKKGSVAMIQSIKVECQECITTTVTIPTTTTKATTTTTVAATTTIAPAVCKAIACNFEQGNTCAYSRATDAGGNNKWDVVTPPWQNKLTGLPTAAQGSKCAGSYLPPGDSCAMATNVNFPAGYIVRFYAYRATEGIDLKACCDSTRNCPFTTTNRVQASDYRNWVDATVTCPAGTKRVLFQAVNSGQNYGGVGLDNIQVLSQVDKSPLC